MARIAREAESPANYHMMFTTLWKRLTDYQHIKHVLKALVLIDYLLKHCHERFVSDVRLRADVIRRLKHYKYFEDGRDIGSEVRHKAQAVMALLENKELLQKERRIARETEGKIKGFSYEYSGFYNDAEGDRADPFGAVENEERLQLEYNRGESMNNARYEDHKTDDEQDADQHDEEAPKPKKKSNKVGKKNKKSKKAVKKSSSADAEAELSVEADAEEEPSNPPNYAQKDFFDGFEEDSRDQNKKASNKVRPKAKAPMDDFLADMSNAKPMVFEPDLVTGGYNSAAAAQFGWLTTVAPEPQSNADIALFDIVHENKPAVSSAPAKASELEGAYFDFGHKDSDVSTSTPFDDEVKVEKTAAPIDPWDVAKEISILDNLHETTQERQIKQNLHERRERMKNGPKLNDLQKKAREERSNVNPFDAMVQGAPSSDYTSQSMALVPVGGSFYGDPSQAMVPMNPYGGYGGFQPMQPYPPMTYHQPDHYGYTRPY